MRVSLIGLRLLVSGALLGLVAAPAIGQTATATTVTIPEVKGAPAEARPAPVTLTLDKEVEIGSLSMTIRFPANLLTFEKVEVSGVAQGVGAEAKAEIKKDEEQKDDTVLQFTIATPEKDGARPALPQGPLANLWFKIAKDAQPKTIIPLKIVAATATGSKTATETVPLETRDGQISVSTPVVFACFFYMH